MRSISILWLVLSVVPACTLGLRASGGCPAGEVCSDLTPDGLLFSGDYVQSGSDPFVPIAAGGSRHLEVGAIGVALPAYDALVRETSIAAVTTTTDRGELVLTGNAPGRTLLRLVAAGTNELLDAVPLRVEAISSVVVAPIATSELAPGTTSWAFYGGAEQSLAVELAAADGTRLVDEGLTITGLPLTSTRWNLFQLAADTAEGVHPITVRAGDADFTSEIAVTRTLDRIAFGPEGTALVVGDVGIYCVLGVDAARSVWGIPATFEGDARITVTPSGPSCVQVEAVAAGAARLDATFETLSTSLTLDIAPAMEGMASMPLTSSLPIFRTVRGLRAGR